MNGRREIARAYVTALRDLLRALGVSDVRMDQGSMRCDCQRLAEADRGNRIRHPHRDQERQLAQERRGRGALRDAPPGRGSGGRRPRSPGNQALSRGRVHQRRAAARRPPQDYRYFPEPDLEPVAPQRASSSSNCGRPFPSYPWLQRKRIQQDWGISDEVMRDLVNAGADRIGGRHRRARRVQRAGPRLVGKLPGAEGQRGRCRARRAGHHARPGRRGGRVGRRGQAVQQAGPSGRRGRAGRRG